MTIEEEVKSHEDRHWKAMRDGDVGTLTKLWSDRLIYGHSGGARDDKGGMLDKIATRYMTFKSIDIDREQILGLGTTVLIIGRMRADAHSATLGARRMDNLYLAVWTKEDDSWKLVAFQPTPYQDHRDASAAVDAYIAKQKAKTA